MRLSPRPNLDEGHKGNVLICGLIPNLHREPDVTARDMANC